MGQPQVIHATPSKSPLDGCLEPKSTTVTSEKEKDSEKTRQPGKSVAPMSPFGGKAPAMKGTAGNVTKANGGQKRKNRKKRGDTSRVEERLGTTVVWPNTTEFEVHTRGF